jgi:phage-related protein (TIGR01555 family)
MDVDSRAVGDALPTIRDLVGDIGLQAEVGGERIDRLTIPLQTDRWVNPYTGFGTHSHDKRQHTSFVADQVSYREAQELWASNAMVAKAVEEVPSECWREGFDLRIKDEGGDDLARLAMAEWKRLAGSRRIKRIHEFERAYGGGGGLLLVNDGRRMDEPLDIDRVSEFRAITALEPIEIWPTYFYNDPSKPKCGEPSHFQLTAISTGASYANASSGMMTGIIHESRLIVFGGIHVSKFQIQSGPAGSFWGYSMITRFFEALRDFCQAAASTGIIVTDFSQSVMEIENLQQLLTQENGAGFHLRMRMVEMMRSVARMVVTDVKEKVSRQSTSVAGLRELLDFLAMRLGSDIDMPLTRLLGQSPKGLGNEGESDETWWYDRVAAIQRDRLDAPVEYIFRIIFRTIGDRQEPDDWCIEWRDLKRMTLKQQAEIQYTTAQTHALNIANGVYSAEAARRGSYGGPEFSIYPHVDLEAEAAQDEIARQAALAPQPGDLAAMTGQKAPPVGPDGKARLRPRRAGGEPRRGRNAGRAGRVRQERRRRGRSDGPVADHRPRLHEEESGVRPAPGRSRRARPERGRRLDRRPGRVGEHQVLVGGRKSYARRIPSPSTERERPGEGRRNRRGILCPARSPRRTLATEPGPEGPARAGARGDVAADRVLPREALDRIAVRVAGPSRRGARARRAGRDQAEHSPHDRARDQLDAEGREPMSRSIEELMTYAQGIADGGKVNKPEVVEFMRDLLGALEGAVDAPIVGEAPAPLVLADPFAGAAHMSPSVVALHGRSIRVESLPPLLGAHDARALARDLCARADDLAPR